MFRFVAILIVVFLSGCSTLPKSSKVEAFGVAVSNGLKILDNAAQTNKKFAFEIGEEEQAFKYVIGENFTLGDVPDAFINPKRIAFRKQRLRTLAAYGAALKTAADKGTILELEQASVRLGAAAGKIVSEVSPVSAPIAAPATKLVGRTLGFVLGNAYAAEMQAIIIAGNSDVEKVVELLKEDFAGHIATSCDSSERFRETS